MTAVVAAIAAAFLAGAVALFREHRLQQRRLLVASRVTYATFDVAANGIRASLETNGWSPFDLLPRESSFSSTWESHRGDLAGHLTWDEWGHIEKAVNGYLAVRTMSQADSPKNAQPVLEATLDLLSRGNDALRPYCVQRLSLWKLIQRWIPARRHEPKPE